MAEDAAAVATEHPDYTAAKATWQKCRDAAEDAGEAIKAGGYVRHLNGESEADYQERVDAGLWYAATSATLKAWLGALFHKPGTLNVPDTIKKQHVPNIDLAGTSYPAFKRMCEREVLLVGRVGVYADWSQGKKRPYWVRYRAEQIINWSVRVLDDGSVVPDLVVLHDPVRRRGEDGFTIETVERYRVLELVNDVFVVRIFEADSDGKIVEMVNVDADGVPVPIMPNKQGVPLNFIPFECWGPYGRGFDIQSPPILPVVAVNIDHFRLDVDYKEALHANAIATLFVAGDNIDTDDNGNAIPKDYLLGSRVSNNIAAGATAEFKSGAAQSEPVANEKLADEERMALLGARMLSKPKRAAETAEALQIQAAGEEASLQQVADTATEAFTQLWRWHVQRMGAAGEDVGDTFSRDFTSTALSEGEVAQRLALVIAGKLSTETFLEQLFNGEWIQHDAKTELQRLDEEMVGAETALPVSEIQSLLAEIKAANGDTAVIEAAAQAIADLIAHDQPADQAA